MEAAGFSPSIFDHDIAVSGASGYLGRALISRLTENPDRRIYALSRSGLSPHIRTLQGDLLKPETLSGWLSPGSTVIHLAYMWSAGTEANILATKNLLEVCRRARVARFIHISTAAVVGRADTNWIDELTPCRPVTEYGRTKLHIEELIRDGAVRCGLDLVILRPTSVFGPGGAPLKKLCEDLTTKFWVVNYLKACLFGRRAMNLIHVNNVVSAILFAVDHPKPFGGVVLSVSDDDAEKNNFLDIEQMARNSLGVKPYPLPVVPLPFGVLTTLLRMLRRNIVDPTCRFRADRIRELGYLAISGFEDGVLSYLDWYRHETQKSLAESLSDSKEAKG